MQPLHRMQRPHRRQLRRKRQLLLRRNLPTLASTSASDAPARPAISAMLEVMAMARFGRVGLHYFALLIAGCVEQPGAQRIVGPDGTQMLHVHCGDEQVACFQMAGERCPRGYDLSPIFDPHDGNFLVRCRTPSTTPAYVTVAPSTPRAAPTQAPTNDGWPPAEVARPSEPWPTPSSNVPSRTIDIGY